MAKREAWYPGILYALYDRERRLGKAVAAEANRLGARRGYLAQRARKVPVTLAPTGKRE
jgi:hypothetical protein